MAERSRGGKTRNLFVWIILGLLFVGLMGFGATGLSGTVRSVGQVGDLPITTQSYFNALRGQIDQRSALAGRQISFPEAAEQRLPEQALASLVGTRVLDNEAAQLGLSVGDEIISEQVRAITAFRGSDGSFSPQTYRDVLDRQGSSPREFETSLREDTTRSLLQGAVFTGLPDAQTFGNSFAAFTREGRSFTWAPVTADQIEIALPEPSEADLQSQYDENPALYTSLESRAIDYAWITPDMIQDQVTVSEEELRAEYEARIDEFVIPERRLVERLVFPDDAAAETAIAAINTGETDFPALVADRGLSLDDVDIGDVSEAEMGVAGPAIFALENGQVTGPFASEFGPALYRMNAVLAARDTSFEEAVPELREDQAAARARRMIDDQIDAINDLLAGGATITDLAAQTDMQIGQISFSEDSSDGIAAYAEFREQAATQSTSDYPSLSSLDDGGLFALAVTEITPPALQPLDAVRDQVITDWEASARAEAILEAAENFKAQLETDSDFSALGLEAVEELNLTRRAFVNGTPPNFMQTVFEMQPAEIRTLPHEGGAIVVRLDAILPPDSNDEATLAEIDTLSETAAEGMAQDLFELYLRAIQMRTDISINEQAINAVHSNFR